jgi:thioredoxin reductase
VVLATGIDYFRHIPESLAHLPAELLSHSADHHDLHRFAGKEVAVIGSGASASDLAILLHEAGAKVQLIARKPAIPFGGPWAGPSRTLWRRIRAPISAIGPGWRSKIYTDAPWLYRYLPEQLRIRTVKSHLGPSGGWFMKERAAKVPFLLGYQLHDARASDGRVQLQLMANDGSRREVTADHVIAATGYQADVRRLPFLSHDILDQLQLIERAPRLSAHFESSVPGLYFVGPIAAMSFGPVMRFAAGAEFTSRRISMHLARAAEADSSRSALNKASTAPSPRSWG